MRIHISTERYGMKALIWILANAVYLMGYLLMLGAVGMVLEICIALKEGWSEEADADEDCDCCCCASDMACGEFQGSDADWYDIQDDGW